MGFLDKLFGSYSDRELKKINPIADAIEKLDAAYSKLSDVELRAKTDAFRQRLAGGETLDDILVDAFAAVRDNRQFFYGAFCILLAALLGFDRCAYECVFAVLVLLAAQCPPADLPPRAVRALYPQF